MYRSRISVSLPVKDAFPMTHLYGRMPNLLLYSVRHYLPPGPARVGTWGTRSQLWYGDKGCDGQGSARGVAVSV